MEPLLDSLDHSVLEWPREETQGVWIRGDMTWRWTARGDDAPACPGCAAPLSETDGDELRCGSCDATTHTQVVPEAIRARLGNTVWFIGGSPELERPTEAVAPVVLRCPACDAGLSLGPDEKQIAECIYCRSQVHIPDAVWRQLHPTETVVPWTLRLEGPSDAARHQERQELREREREADERAEKLGRQRRAEARPTAPKPEAVSVPEEEAPRLRFVAWFLTGSAILWIGLSAVAYFSGAEVLGLSLRALFGVTGFVWLLAWLAGNAFAIRRAHLSWFYALRMSWVMALVTAVPVVGVFVSLLISRIHFDDTEPSDPGAPLRRHVPEGEVRRNPSGSGRPLALLYLFSGVFFTLLISTLTGHSLGELAELLSDD
jgi:hypothetical protein